MSLPASLFQALVHFAPDAFLVTDAGGVIVFANAQAEALFGYERDELVGSRVEMLVPAPLRERHVAHRSEYSADPHSRPMGSGLALEARRRDGSDLPVEISLSPVYTDAEMYVVATVRDVTVQRRLEEERRLLLAESEIERERERIAADLHDGVMQTMYSVGLQLSSIVRGVADLPEPTRDGLREAIAALDAAIRDIRGYVMDLRPADFADSLGESLEGLLRLFESGSGIRVTYHRQADLPPIDEAAALELFLLTREALSNIRRHAAASEVTVTLGLDGGRLALTVTDDGTGFDHTRQRREEQFGLRNMETRARMAGGELTIESTPGRGTTVRIEIDADRVIPSRAARRSDVTGAS